MPNLTSWAFFLMQSHKLIYLVYTIFNQNKGYHVRHMDLLFTRTHPSK